MRYIIGIDLGTTNSCVAYVDLQDTKRNVRVFPIMQLTGSGQCHTKPILPSFCYCVQSEKWDKGALNLPWKEQQSYFVGEYALEHGERTPTRLVSSAKSWLCHSGTARRSPILPPMAEDNVKISPVEASARYLRHIAEAWNWSIAKGKPEDEIDQQDVIITVPASFDEVARSLTLEAAKKAGFGSITMLEEPQAAFYNWLEHNAKKWNTLLNSGDCVLVCDVGGGTTDFSLINVEEVNGTQVLRRMAVGDHLLLGGENIDAAIAHHVSERLHQEKKYELSPTQWTQLLYQSKRAKEAICGGHQDHFRITLTGVGSKVVGGSTSIEVDKNEINTLVIDGFFGTYDWEEAIQVKPNTGFRTLGLPYENEPSITKHLAYFLHTHAAAKPTHILFNGGTMQPTAFQNAVLKSLTRWYKEPPTALIAPHFDMAVARGAAYYGLVRRGEGVKVGGGSARCYYLEINIKDSSGSSATDTGSKALTILPRGAEEGSQFEAEPIFHLHPNQPVSFQVYSSHVRLNDKEGSIVEINEEEMHKLPPIHTVLQFGKKENIETIPVRIKIEMTAIGTLEIWLESTVSPHRWLLEFQLKSAGGQEDAAKLIGKAREDVTYDATYLVTAQKIIEETFNSQNSVNTPKNLMDRLETELQMSRKDWPSSILRGLWQPLINVEKKRTVSMAHEERWWNLAGFLLRPGMGYPLDDFRVKDIWKIILAEQKKPKAPEITLQQLICYRRIAAGLNRGQQTQLGSELMSQLFDNRSALISRPQQVYIERLRCIASFELIDNALKLKLGSALLKKIAKGEGASYEFWALGKLGSRHLFHGTLSNVLPARDVSKWIEELLSLSLSREQAVPLFTQLARLTGNKELDISASLRNKIVDAYSDNHLKSVLLTVQPILKQELEQSYGEALPLGLTLNLDL